MHPVPETRPRPNPLAEWRVELHDGGCKTILYSGSEDKAWEYYEKRRVEKVHSGSLQLFAPKRGMPVEQTVSVGYRPTVSVPEDYKGGKEPPVVSVKRPDMEEIMSHFGKAGRVVSDKPEPQQTGPAPITSPAPRPARTTPETQKWLLHDLAIVDAAISNVELVAAVLAKHRSVLIQRLSTSQDGSGLISDTIASLEKLL